MAARRDAPLALNTVARIRTMHDDGLSASAIADTLNAWRIPTVRGGRWSHVQVLRVINGRREATT